MPDKPRPPHLRLAIPGEAADLSGTRLTLAEAMHAYIGETELDEKDLENAIDTMVELFLTDPRGLSEATSQIFPGMAGFKEFWNSWPK